MCRRPIFGRFPKKVIAFKTLTSGRWRFVSIVALRLQGRQYCTANKKRKGGSQTSEFEERVEAMWQSIGCIPSLLLADETEQGKSAIPPPFRFWVQYRNEVNKNVGSLPSRQPIAQRREQVVPIPRRRGTIHTASCKEDEHNRQKVCGLAFHHIQR
jgi:hypothetical protein